MKNYFILSLIIFCLSSLSRAQSYSPIVTAGYNLDAVAENTTALATTGGAIDGSGYVLYSNAYGIIVGGATTGLPNNGIISGVGRSYQLSTYSLTNVLYVQGLQSDTLLFTTPAFYPTLSMAGFATEGNATMNIKVRFTDGSSQSFSNITVEDWFSTIATNIILAGFDRVTRSTGTPNYNSTFPKMFYFDFNLSCANRLKQVAKIIVQNLSGNARLCMMAVSGGAPATYTANTSPVTCAGGNNGTASVTVIGGAPPFTYAWGTIPAQSSASVNLPAGITNYTVTDAAGCNYFSSVTINQVLMPTVPLVLNASQNPICAGNTVTLSTSGAVTYTWNNNSTSNTTTVSSTANAVYSVSGTTSLNCTVSGNITLSITPLPILTFTTIPPRLCLNASGIILNASPSGGSYSGAAIQFGQFFPNLAGPGTHTVSYMFTDLNSCTSEMTVTTTISSPTTIVGFAVNPSALCTTAANLTLIATPAGGTFSGTAVNGSVFSPAISGVGAFNITYTHTDANNCSASKVASVIVKACETSGVGIAENKKGVTCLLYPNPNNGSFTIVTDRDMAVLVINGLGQTVRTMDLEYSNAYTASVEDLEEGIYFLSTTEYSLQQQIIVTK